MSNVHFIQYKEWTEFIAPAIKEVHKTDIFNFFGRVLQQNPQSVWSSTSNVYMDTAVCLVSIVRS